MKFLSTCRIVPVLVFFSPLSAQAAGSPGTAAAKEAPAVDAVPSSLSEIQTAPSLSVNSSIPASTIQKLPEIRPLSLHPSAAAWINNKPGTLGVQRSVSAENFAASAIGEMTPAPSDANADRQSPSGMSAVTASDQIERMARAAPAIAGRSSAEQKAAASREFGENIAPMSGLDSGAVLPPEARAEFETKSERDPDEPKLIYEVIRTKGDTEAFEALHRKNAPIVFKFLRGFLHNDATAEDLTQTVFLNWLRSVKDGKYSYRTKLSSYLCGNARNLAINHVRDLQFVPGFRKPDASLDEMLSSAKAGEGGGNESPLERIVGRRDAWLEGTLDRLTLERALQNLSLENREILELHFYEGLKIREIAERMHRPLPAVQSQLYRALSSLQGFIPRKRSHSLAAAKAEVDPVDEPSKEPVSVKAMAKAAGR